MKGGSTALSRRLLSVFLLVKVLPESPIATKLRKQGA